MSLAPVFAMAESSNSQFQSRRALGQFAFLTILSCFACLPTISAQSVAPVLISHEDSTRAIAFESVTQQREPFSTTAPVRFGTDNQTRIMLFAMNLMLQRGDTVSAITVEAEDFNHRGSQLTVEFIGTVPDQPWATSLVVELNDDMRDVVDVLTRVSYRG